MEDLLQDTGESARVDLPIGAVGVTAGSQSNVATGVLHRERRRLEEDCGQAWVLIKLKE